MNPQLKESIAQVLYYVLLNEEDNYEETMDEYGVESVEAQSHIYTLARNLWAELELDITEGV